MRTTTLVKERFQLTLADPVLELFDQEAQLVSMDRAAFARALLGRAMGKLPIERPSHAPPRDRIPMPRRKRATKRGTTPNSARMPTTKIVIGFPEEQCDWLRQTAWQLGGMPYSSLMTYLLLDWCGINPLTETKADPAAAA